MEETWHKPRSELRAILRSLGQYLSGELADPTGVVEKMYLELGRLALTLISEAFLIKAGRSNQPGVDATGDHWQVLAPSTVRRRKKKRTWGSGQVLVETGGLYRSLQPQAAFQAGDQLFVVLRDGVVVGTRLQRGREHHEGHPAKNLPVRRLWPKWQDWPEPWRQRFGEVITRGVGDLLRALLQAAR